MKEQNGFWDVLTTLEQWQIFTILVVLGVFYFVTKHDLINKYLTSKKKSKSLIQNEKMALELEAIKKQIVENSLKNIEIAAHQAVESLQDCIGANYYIVHDSGEDLTIADKWYLTVLRSTSYAIQTDYASPQEMEDGYKFLNSETRDRLFYVVSDSVNDDRFKKERNYLKAMSINSFCCCIVQNNKSNYHMISFNFDCKDPSLNNPDLRKIAFAFKRAVLANI